MTTEGVAYCWGVNTQGQIGNGSESFTIGLTAVTGGLGFQTVNVDNDHSCGVTDSGDIFCWGDNFAGQLENRSDTDTNAPVEVAGGFTFQSVSTGFQRSCGLTTAGAGYCWGFGSHIDFSGSSEPVLVGT